MAITHNTYPNSKMEKQRLSIGIVSIRGYVNTRHGAIDAFILEKAVAAALMLRYVAKSRTAQHERKITNRANSFN